MQSMRKSFLHDIKNQKENHKSPRYQNTMMIWEDLYIRPEQSVVKTKARYEEGTVQHMRKSFLHDTRNQNQNLTNPRSQKYDDDLGSI